MNRTIALPEFADVSASKTTVNSWLAKWLGNEMGKMGFNISLHRGAGPFELAESFEFIGDELEVRRILKWKEAFEKCHRFHRPMGFFESLRSELAGNRSCHEGMRY